MDSESRHDADAILVRNSRDADVAAMLAIYLHHIRKGVDPRHQGEIETPDADDLKRRRKSMQRRRMPHIVAEERGVVLGYAPLIDTPSSTPSTSTTSICGAGSDGG